MTLAKLFIFLIIKKQISKNLGTLALPPGSNGTTTQTITDQIIVVQVLVEIFQLRVNERLHNLIKIISSPRPFSF